VRKVKALLYTMADEVQETIKRMVKKVDLGENLGIGADGTPTKLIDDAAEQVVFKVLKDKEENMNILSEEAGVIDNKAKKTLVIDPIDGTHNAVRGIPFYSISLAIGKSRLSDVEYGLVRNLVTGDTYWAEKGKGAFLNDRNINTRQLFENDSMFALYIGERATTQSYGIAKIPRRGRALGCASLEMCLVASGAFDVYYLSYSPSNYSMSFDIKARTNVIAVGDRRALEILRKADITDTKA